jgi:WD40 repeat protein
MAKVSLSLDAWKDGRVAPAAVEVPVIVHEVVDSPELRATLQGHGGPVWSIAVAPDGQTLASGTQAGHVKLWDIARNRERNTLESGLGNSFSLAFSPDGQTLAVAHNQWDAKRTEYSGGIVLWDVATGNEKARLQHSSPCGATQVAFSPDGKTMSIGEKDRRMSTAGKSHSGTSPRAKYAPRCRSRSAPRCASHRTARHWS